MGYRFRLGRIPKSAREEIIGLTYDQVVAKYATDEEGGKKYFSVYRELPGFEELYELGKYCDFGDKNADYMEEFYSFNCSEETECEFWIVNKDFLRAVIEDYIKNTAEYYKEQQTTIKKIVEHLKDPSKVSVEDIMGKPETEDESWEEYEARQKARESVGEIYSNIRQKADEWGGYFGIKSHLYIDEPIDKRDGMLTRSWSREYSVFNLLYIYNTFDWENDYLIYNAW